jgi:hypothetical protein
MRLLQQNRLLSLHKEPEEEENRPPRDMQELLVEHEQEAAVQERELTERLRRIMVICIKGATSGGVPVMPAS